MRQISAPVSGRASLQLKVTRLPGEFTLRAWTADADLGLLIQGRTTACDPLGLGGDQCGEQRGPDLKHSTFMFFRGTKRMCNN